MGVSFQIQYISSQTQSFPYPPTIISFLSPTPAFHLVLLHPVTRFNDTNSTPKHLGEILK